jgi:hypothetical protein
MWKPQPLATLRASTACTGITLPFTVLIVAYEYVVNKHLAHITAYIPIPFIETLATRHLVSFALITASDPNTHPVGSIAAWFCSLKDSEPNSTAVTVDSTRIYYISEERRVNIPQMIHVLKKFN